MLSLLLLGTISIAVTVTLTVMISTTSTNHLIEDALRGRTTARPPLVNGLGLNRRLLEADFGSGLDGVRHTLEALGGILEAF